MWLSSNPIRAVIACGVGLAFSAASEAAKPLYDVQDLGAASPAQINRRGQIAGDFERQPALWTGGAWKVLGKPSGDASGLTDSGAVVGSIKTGAGYRAVVWKPNGQRVDLIKKAQQRYATAASPDGTLYGAALPAYGQAPYAYSWRKGVVQILPGTDYPWTVVRSATDAGDLAGYTGPYYCESCCPSKPAVFIGGSWTVIEVSGSCGAASGINQAGTAVGSSYNPGLGDTKPFIYRSGVVMELDFKGTALAINSAGDIVGGRYDELGNPHPFLLKDGATVPLDLDTLIKDVPPHGTVWYATSINDAGQITVKGTEPNNAALHSYLLTPR